MAEITLQPREPNERPFCVCCRGELGSNDAALACTDCASPLHWECWRSLKQCPTPGCGGKAKHSDRLTQTLSTWGPAAPQIRLDEDEIADESLPAPPTPAPTPPHKAADTGEPADPLPERPRTPTGDRHYHYTLLDAFQLAYEPQLPLRLRGKVVAAKGMIYGPIGGSILGGIYATTLSRHVETWLIALGLLLGACAGIAIGGTFGYLQGLVGLAHPQREGLGIVTALVVSITLTVAAVSGGWVLGLLVGVPVTLLCGRLFGYNPGREKN